MKRALPCLAGAGAGCGRLLSGCGGRTAETARAGISGRRFHRPLGRRRHRGRSRRSSTDETAAVYTAHDIVYYEAGRDFTYGEGTEADEHTAGRGGGPHGGPHHPARHLRPQRHPLRRDRSPWTWGRTRRTTRSAVVTLILNGVDITCTVAPAVIFYNVYECGST